MTNRLNFRNPRAAALVLACCGTLAAQVGQMGGKNGSNQTSKMADLDLQRQTHTLMYGVVVGDRVIKPQGDPAENVGALPAGMPSSIAWEATGFKWGGTWPLFTDEGLFVAAGDHKLHSLNLQTGMDLWTCKLKSDVVTQLVMAQGILLGLDNGSLVSVDPKSGKIRWTASLDSAKGGKFCDEEVQPISQPTVMGDRIYVGTFAANILKASGRLYALDAATGKRIWEKELPHGVTQAPFVAGDAVWAGGGDHFGAYDLQDGHEIKSFKVQDGALGPVVGKGTRFYFGSGKEVFSLDPAQHEVALVSAFSLGKGIAAQGAFVAASHDVLVVQDGAAGKEGWRKEGKWMGAPVVNDGRVFALSSAKTFSIFNLGDGTSLATLALSEESGFPRPLVHGNQALVLGKRPKGMLLEAFQGPQWRRSWALTILDTLVTIPSFSSQGMLLWTEADQLRMIR